MTSQKLMISISTIPNESKILMHHNSTLSYSTNDIRLPYKQTLPLKFPKRYITKKTEMNMLKQTDPNPERSTIRNFNDANRSRVFDQPDRKKRIMKQGLFHSLSKQTPQIMPLNRTQQDIGAPNNRKRHIESRFIKPDPIVIGAAFKKTNSALQKVWTEPRRHRDNGKECQETLKWNTEKKQSGYLDRYRNNKPKNHRFQNPTKYSIIS